MNAKPRPLRAKMGLLMAPWFDDTCKAYKTQIQNLAKQRLPLTDLKKAYITYSRMRKRSYDKQKAQELVDMIDLRDVKAYKAMKVKPQCQTTPIPADVWTNHLKDHFVQNSVTERNEGLSSGLPSGFQLQSIQLRTGQTTPSEIVTPPGPGGRYRQNNRSNEGPRLIQTSTSQIYETPSAAELSTYVQTNISRMNGDSSSGFDPYTTPFIKYAVEKYKDENAREQSKNILQPLLTNLFKFS